MNTKSFKSLIIIITLILVGCNSETTSITYAEKKFKVEKELEGFGCSFDQSINEFKCNHLTSYNLTQLDKMEFGFISLKNEIENYLKSIDTLLIDARVIKKHYALTKTIESIKAVKSISNRTKIFKTSPYSLIHIDNNCDSLTKKEAQERTLFVRRCFNFLQNMNHIEDRNTLANEIQRIEEFNAKNKQTAPQYTYPVLVYNHSGNSIKLEADEYTSCSSIEESFFAVTCSSDWRF